MIIELIEEAIRNERVAKEKLHEGKTRFHPTDAAKCPRQLYYDFTKADKEEYSTKELKTFAIGDVTHEYLENLMPNQLRKEFKFLIDDWHGYKLSGAPDSIVLVPLLNSLVIVDFKTVKNNGMNYVASEPKEEHVKQLMVYLDVFGLKTGYLVYWGKDDGAMIEHRIDYDATVIKKVLKLFKLVSAALKSGRVPAGTNDWGCRYCAYRNTCTK